MRGGVSTYLGKKRPSGGSEKELQSATFGKGKKGIQMSLKGKKSIYV